MGRGTPAADPNISPPRQHAAPDEHAPLLSDPLTQATEEDESEVSVTPGAEHAQQRESDVVFRDKLMRKCVRHC